MDTNIFNTISYYAKDASRDIFALGSTAFYFLLKWVLGFTFPLRTFRRELPCERIIPLGRTNELEFDKTFEEHSLPNFYPWHIHVAMRAYPCIFLSEVYQK